MAIQNTAKSYWVALSGNCSIDGQPAKAMQIFAYVHIYWPKNTRAVASVIAVSLASDGPERLGVVQEIYKQCGGRNAAIRAATERYRLEKLLAENAIEINEAGDFIDDF